MTTNEWITIDSLSVMNIGWVAVVVSLSSLCVVVVVSMFKLSLIYNRVTWIKNHLCVTVLLEVRKDMEELLQMSLSWERKM